MLNKEEEYAIIDVLNYLYKHEPSCSSCDHCIYSYNNLKAKNDCKKRQKRIQEEHKKWENKIKKWKKRLKNLQLR